MADFETPDRSQEEFEQTFTELATIIQTRRRQRDFVQEKTALFVNLLFSALQEVIYDCRQRGLTELAEPRLIDHPASGGRRALQIGIEDWGVIFVPLVGIARPNLRDEAQIPPVAFKQISGRIAVFIGSDQASTAFYDFLILNNGAWFAWGYGWPRQASTIEETDFKLLALNLLTSFVKDIFITWRVRDETTLADAMDARRRAYNFGLPGDEA